MRELLEAEQQTGNPPRDALTLIGEDVERNLLGEEWEVVRLLVRAAAAADGIPKRELDPMDDAALEAAARLFHCEHSGLLAEWLDKPLPFPALVARGEASGLVAELRALRACGEDEGAYWRSRFCPEDQVMPEPATTVEQAQRLVSAMLARPEQFGYREPAEPAPPRWIYGRELTVPVEPAVLVELMRLHDGSELIGGSRQIGELGESQIGGELELIEVMADGQPTRVRYVSRTDLDGVSQEDAITALAAASGLRTALGALKEREPGVRPVLARPPRSKAHQEDGAPERLRGSWPACPHERSSWRVDAEDSGLVLACPDCHAGRLARVARHRLPVGIPPALPAESSEFGAYLRRERLQAELGVGPPWPLEQNRRTWPKQQIHDLRERDGIANLEALRAATLLGPAAIRPKLPSMRRLLRD